MSTSENSDHSDTSGNLSQDDEEKGRKTAEDERPIKSSARSVTIKADITEKEAANDLVQELFERHRASLKSIEELPSDDPEIKRMAAAVTSTVGPRDNVSVETVIGGQPIEAPRMEAQGSNSERLKTISTAAPPIDIKQQMDDIVERIRTMITSASQFERASKTSIETIISICRKDDYILSRMAKEKSVGYSNMVSMETVVSFSDVPEDDTVSDDADIRQLEKTFPEDEIVEDKSTPKRESSLSNFSSSKEHQKGKSLYLDSPYYPYKKITSRKFTVGFERRGSNDGRKAKETLLANEYFDPIVHNFKRSISGTDAVGITAASQHDNVFLGEERKRFSSTSGARRDSRGRGALSVEIEEYYGLGKEVTYDDRKGRIIILIICSFLWFFSICFYIIKFGIMESHIQADKH